MDAGYLTPDKAAWERARKDYDLATAKLIGVHLDSGFQRTLDEVNAAREALLALPAPGPNEIAFKLQLLWLDAPERSVDLSPEQARVIGDLRRVAWHSASGD